MTRIRALAGTMLMACMAVLLLPGVALAVTSADVASALRNNPVYVDAKATARVDPARLRTEIDRAGRPIYVAVLPQAAADNNGGRTGVTNAIGKRLGVGVILFVVVGDNTLAGGSGSGAGLARGQADSIATRNEGSDVTAALLASISQATAAAGRAPTGAPDRATAQPVQKKQSGTGGTVLAVGGVLAVAAAGGGAALFARSRKRRSRELQGARADVQSLYDRLGADVSNLSPGEDPVARQALADAAERYNATGALLSQSDTPGEYAAARRTVVEGLTAARLVRTRIGLDPGPEIPPPPGSGPQLQGDQRVRVGDQEYDGSPQYAPGRGHYFGGGYYGGSMVPGGWYSVPFWETLAISSVLGGAFGGGYGGFGGGFERGYEEGVEDARDSGSDGGSYGGNDSGWSGGGGGDSGGGGDWGGGGGDSGGGGDWGGGGDGGGGGSW